MYIHLDTQEGCQHNIVYVLSDHLQSLIINPMIFLSIFIKYVILIPH